MSQKWMSDEDLAEIEAAANTGISQEEARAMVAEIRRLNGTKAVKKEEFIPFHKATIYPKHVEAVTATLQSGWLSTAGACEAFEQAFLKRVGGKYAVSVNSCTAAIHLALAPLIKDKGDEVIVSPITFVSVVNAIEHLGGRVVFADVRDSDLTIDPASVEALVNNRTKAIIATHFAGIPCQMDELQAAADRVGAAVITDAAHAIEARYGDSRSGELGHAACYSFYATKNITTGEGGMLVTDSEKLADYARRMRINGMDKDAWKRYGPAGYKHWDVPEPGWKLNMSDLNASLGMAQLEDMENWHGTRRQLNDYYEMEFRKDPRIKLLEAPDGCSSALHLFVIRIKNRELAMERIQERGVGVGVHFRGIHTLKHWRGQDTYVNLKNADKASEEVLSLPLYPTLGIPGANRVVKVVSEVLNELG